ncbi:MAG: DUF2383 domain-containing protein [Ectothiorhodospiraceae bacterium]|nr:DUF2383 domain-containing protein [Ectothiorhodospiraceae bacterium]MCH8503956.1 DUF2383 domain-containing protein [Ectothiorhodospiraceae bacterium]
MLRDEATVALNELLVQCETNAEHFRYTADLIDEPEVRSLLAELANERDQLADALRQRMRQRDELPDTADSELGALQELGDTIASNLADWGRTRVIESRIRDEQRLAELAAEALSHLVDADYRATVEQIREKATSGATRLGKR